jgi:hypothetical protein
VTVSGLDQNTKWRDLHILSARESKFPRLGTSSGVLVQTLGGGASQTWSAQRSGGGSEISVYTGAGAGDPAGFGNGTFTVNVPWNGGDYAKAGSDPVKWFATKDGTQTRASDKSDILDTSSGKPAPNVPQLTIHANNEEDLAAPLNATSAFNVTAEGFGGFTYEVFAATALNVGFTDPLHLGIETESSPVPSAWGLTFGSFTGSLASSGRADPAPSITVPSDAALNGHQLYLVFAVKENGAIIHMSSPITVTLGS